MKKTVLLTLFLTLCMQPQQCRNANVVSADAEDESMIYPREQQKTEMVLIPAGEFLMGSSDTDADADEKPVHSVYVDAFEIDVFEVTNAQFKAFVDANPQWRKAQIPDKFHRGYYLNHWEGDAYPVGRATHPVVYVSWYAAMAYAKWAGKRLPTEAEWEKAARGGLIGKPYPWGDEIDASKANYGSKRDGTTPVGEYPPNGYGVYDMVGNVSEWCLDAYDAEFYHVSPKRNPLAGHELPDVLATFTEVPENKVPRVLRGGSWLNVAYRLRVAVRDRPAPTYALNFVGFRCVRDVLPRTPQTPR